ncbi:MAG: hypothetical protein ACLR0U_29940 [Enterocloster clostridioformis]
MPGTAAKKYEEGIVMKKIVKGILLLCSGGCHGYGMLQDRYGGRRRTY